MPLEFNEEDSVVVAMHSDQQLAHESDTERLRSFLELSSEVGVCVCFFFLLWFVMYVYVCAGFVDKTNKKVSKYAYMHSWFYCT
jgi:hypothetical protein